MIYYYGSIKKNCVPITDLDVLRLRRNNAKGVPTVRLVKKQRYCTI